MLHRQAYLCVAVEVRFVSRCDAAALVQRALHLGALEMEEAAGASRSIFGIDPLDDFAVFVGDWIWQNGEGVPDLEVRMDKPPWHWRSCSRSKPSSAC